MARPKSKEAKQQFTVMLKPSIVEKVDKLAEKLELSRSQLLANFIEMGLDDALILNKLGVLEIFRYGGKIAAKLKRNALNDANTTDEESELKI